MRLLLLLLLIGLIALPVQAGPTGPVDTTGTVRLALAHLHAGHPRLIVPDSALPRIREAIATHPLAKEWRGQLQDQAERILGEPPAEHKLVGPRLLSQSRKALQRIYTLALLYRLDGDERFARRARTELLAVAAFPDWNPSHFLDTAEMSHAVGIGYDWLYSFLSPADRRLLRTRLVKLGLEPALAAHRREAWWTKAAQNWNHVCNGGIVLGALAVAEEEPALAEALLIHGTLSYHVALEEFAPDGGYVEGPGYWNYATQYTVGMLAGLESALGTDLGLSSAKGFDETALFPLYLLGPTREAFNYADCPPSVLPGPQLFWLATRFDKPVCAWLERETTSTPSALHLIWFESRGDRPQASLLATDQWYRAIDFVTMRSAWEDDGALFVGFKGGNNHASHAHLDLGTFVFDAQGIRWAVDLGPDDYNLPGYWGAKRYSYYRLSTAGHNTLVINGQNQAEAGKAPITAYSSLPDSAFAVADLSEGYVPHARRVTRGIALVDGRRRVLIQDEIDADRPVEVVWGMHTPAEVVTTGSLALLEQKGMRLFARILEPQDAQFRVVSADAPSPNHPNPEIRKLTIPLPERVPAARIRVLLSPQSQEAERGFVPELIPLADWPSRSPSRTTTTRN